MAVRHDHVNMTHADGTALADLATLLHGMLMRLCATMSQAMQAYLLVAGRFVLLTSAHVGKGSLHHG